jgi:hypothetical protein
MSDSLRIPHQLLQRSIRVVRPRDLEETYARPRQELQRLASQHALLQLTYGYYAIPPAEWLGNAGWRPGVEATALGIAAADHGSDKVALAGPSAARVLGFYPRALAVGVVTVPVRRRALQTEAGRVEFWNRAIDRMETQVWRGELGQGRVTTTEQTLIDIAAHPTLGNISISTAEEILRSLALGADWDHAQQLATDEDRKAAYIRARWFAHALVPSAPKIRKPRHPVSSKGLRPVESADNRSEFGIRND